MGHVASLVGGILGGGSASSYRAPGANPQQLKTAYNQTQAAIKQQQDFVNALQAQNGVANQQNVFGQEQALNNQFGQVAAGQGPNPAMAALNQATGQNVSNQAALMAGQRGASANTGLIARQAAQQGGNLQQQAVGQGATMQAQQSLAAMQAQQAQQAQMAGLANAQVGQTQAGIGQLAGQSQNQYGTLMGQQQQANAVNAQMAQAQAGQQGNLLGQLTGAAGAALAGPLGGAITGGLGKLFSPSSSGMGGMSGDDYFMKYGMGGKAEGGEITNQTGPRSMFGKHLLGMANGGKVPAMVSPGEVYLKPKDVNEVAKGKKAPLDGEKIPGKPKVNGAKNDYANDIVPKTLDEGGIILPRSVTQAKNAPDKAAQFVAAILARKGR